MTLSKAKTKTLSDTSMKVSDSSASLEYSHFAKKHDLGHRKVINSLQESLHSSVNFAIANIQTKADISQSDDIYEQNADDVAKNIMKPSEKLDIKEIPFRPTVSPYAPKFGLESESGNEVLISDPSRVSEKVDKNIVSVLRSSGSQLDGSTKHFMESRFGYDFSNVRIHTDEDAARTAQSINALAYTVGNHIVFGYDKYMPNSNNGRRLLAHELTHVLQQTNRLVGDSNSHTLSIYPVNRNTIQRQSSSGTTTPSSKKILLPPAADIRSFIKSRDPEVFELIKSHPIGDAGDSGAFFDVKDITIQGVRHLWRLAFLFKQNMGIRKGETRIAERSSQKGTEIVKIVIRLGTKFSSTQDIMETILHELLHAMIMIDRDVPITMRSALSRRHEIQQELAPQFFPDTIKKTNSVRSAIQKVGRFFDVFGGKPARIEHLAKEGSDLIIRALIEEKVVNQAADKTKSNFPIALTTVKGEVQEFRETHVKTLYGLQDQRVIIDSHIEQWEETIQNLIRVVAALYDSLDVAEKSIELMINQKEKPSPVPHF